jgi:hypothetical protein
MPCNIQSKVKKRAQNTELQAQKWGVFECREELCDWSRKAAQITLLQAQKSIIFGSTQMTCK